MKKEKEYLEKIISSAELVLDDLEQGAKVSQASFNLLGYADGIMFRIQQDINKDLKPSNIKGGHYPTNGKNHLMDD